MKFGSRNKNVRFKNMMRSSARAMICFASRAIIRPIQRKLQSGPVSVGVVYSYFQDKKDILIQVIDAYLMELEQRFSTVLDEMTAGQELESVIDRFAESLRASHRMNQAAHDEFLALALRNEEIRKKFDSFEDKILQELFRELSKRQNIAKVHLMERLRLRYGVIEHLCHDTICNDPRRMGNC